MGLSLAKEHAHGTRASYVKGCRCDACRKANRAYAKRLRRRDVSAARENAPKGFRRKKTGMMCLGVNGQACPFGTKLRKDSKGYVCKRCRVRLTWNGMVPATRAREHLLALQAQGIGLRSVRDATDIPRSTIRGIRAGTREHLRAQAEAKILAVNELAAAQSVRVPAGPSWQRVRHLVRLGYTRGDIAMGLGNRTAAIQIGRRQVLASTARKLEVLHREWALEAKEATMLDRKCAGACGRIHDAAARRELLTDMGQPRRETLVEDWPCLYGDGQPGLERLERDFAALRRQDSRAPPRTRRSKAMIRKMGRE